MTWVSAVICTPPLFAFHSLLLSLTGDHLANPHLFMHVSPYLHTADGSPPPHRKAVGSFVTLSKLTRYLLVPATGHWTRVSIPFLTRRRTLRTRGGRPAQMCLIRIRIRWRTWRLPRRAVLRPRAPLCRTARPRRRTITQRASQRSFLLNGLAKLCLLSETDG